MQNSVRNDGDMRVTTYMYLILFFSPSPPLRVITQYLTVSPPGERVHLSKLNFGACWEEEKIKWNLAVAWRMPRSHYSHTQAFMPSIHLSSWCLTAGRRDNMLIYLRTFRERRGKAWNKAGTTYIPFTSGFFKVWIVTDYLRRHFIKNTLLTTRRRKAHSS